MASKKIKDGFSGLNSALIVQFVIMLVLSLFITVTISNRTKDNSIEHMGAITDERAHIINNYVENAEKTLTAFSKASQVLNVLESPDNKSAVKAAQEYTEQFGKDIDQLEGIYISQWDTKVLTHTNPEVVGMTTRKPGSALDALHDSLIESGKGVYDTGIIISPASGKQIISMYKTIYNSKNKPIGLVGLGIYTDGLLETLDTIPIRGVENSFYSMVNAYDKQYIFHVDSSRVGEEVSNEKILSLCEKYYGTDKTVTDYFEYKGSDGKKYVSIYNYIPEHGWILMIDDRTSEVFSLTRIMCLYMGVFALILLSLIIVFNIISKRQSAINEKLVSAIAKSNQVKKSLDTAVYKDILTDTGNRVSFSVDMEKASKNPYYFIMFNIASFSEINSRYGNDAGDNILVHTADILREVFENRSIYRTGSDEFIVVIPVENNMPEDNTVIENADVALRKLLLPKEIKNAGTVYPKYKISVIRKDKDINTSVITLLKDMTNKTGEAIHGMIDYQNLTK